MAKGKKKFQKKGPKSNAEKLNESAPGFVDSVASTSNEKLKDLVIQLELQDKEMEDAKKNDTDLSSRVEQAKVARETYSIPMRTNKLKTRFIAELLQQRGKASADEVVK